MSPFQGIRTQLGLSRRQIANRSGLSATAILNTENGLYESIPLDAHVALSEFCRSMQFDAGNWLQNNYGAASLQKAMEIWQQAHRQRSGQEIALSLRGPLSLEHLIALWPNEAQFVKALCIPPSAVHQYKVGDVTAVPQIIQRALSQAGYRHVPLTMAAWLKRSSPAPLV